MTRRREIRRSVELRRAREGGEDSKTRSKAESSKLFIFSVHNLLVISTKKLASFYELLPHKVGKGGGGQEPVMQPLIYTVLIHDTLN